MHYVLIDGDRIGEQIDGFILQNDLAKLSQFTRTLDEAVARIASVAREAGADVFMAGGDNVLARVKDLDKLLAPFLSTREQFPFSFSVGIGSDAKEAHAALDVAKRLAPGTIIRSEVVAGALHFARYDRSNKASAWLPL